ncbi:ribonuclease M [Hypoxylon trugodes]|uniref:ribonuclease M n=1 Tax=Hypoxylon trugodes TaxID=326681 RepID=UPI0021A1162C|nr:ribonuclease M [Hypoxylon trugodes]KAI1386654.1 ribonuclease M [Hypoxylon trugodes]
MASVRTFTAGSLTVLSLAQSVLGGAPKQCTGTSELSCHNSSSVADTCCFNYPGGSLLQTQFWDTDPVVGPDDSWTIHGLWPDHCDGTYDSTCDSKRAYTNISDILKSSGNDDLLTYMETYWLPNDSTGEEFWEHEWGKHGTCVSTLEPSCFTDYQPTEEVPYFFNTTVSLFKSLPTYKWLSDEGITPSSSKSYQLSDIQAALSKNHGGETVYIGCTSGAIEQVYYYFNTYGSVANGQFVPASPDNGDDGGCPDSVKYLPKNGGGSGGGGSTTSPTPTSTTSGGPSPTPTGTFSGKGYLNAVTGGSAKGCLISSGAWYTTGTCATFTAASSGSGFTLKSSKGSCSVSGGSLTCGASTASADSDVFAADGANLANADGNDWYADSVPSGSSQGTVYSEKGSHGTTLQIQWQSA